MMTTSLKAQTHEPVPKIATPQAQHAEKMELQGLLGVSRRWQGSKVSFQYQLETTDFDVFLQMDRHLQKQAQSYLWDEVKVRGCFDEYQQTFHVETLYPLHNDLEAWDNEPCWEDSSLESLEQQILRRGQLETEESP